jgi:hypothetical protein
MASGPCLDRTIQVKEWPDAMYMDVKRYKIVLYDVNP